MSTAQDVHSHFDVRSSHRVTPIYLGLALVAIVATIVAGPLVLSFLAGGSVPMLILTAYLVPILPGLAAAALVALAAVVALTIRIA